MGCNISFHRILEIIAREELWTCCFSMSQFDSSLRTYIYTGDKPNCINPKHPIVFFVQFKHNEQQVFKIFCHQETLNFKLLFGFSTTLL